MKPEEAYPNMVQFLKEGETEKFSLQHFNVTEKEVRHCKMIDAIHGRREYAGFTAGKYVKLVRKNTTFNNIVMSDTWMEKYTNMEVYYHAKGDVLIAGLGIGMVLLGIQSKPEVTSITVVEKEQEIISLVTSHLPLNDKVTIVHSDIFSYVPDRKFDTIYFDIWDNLCGDNWEEMKKLHRKFVRKRKPNGWMSSWRKWEHQELHRRG